MSNETSYSSNNSLKFAFESNLVKAIKDGFTTKKTLEECEVTFGNHNLIEDEQTGTIVCKNCGLVLENNIVAPELSGSRTFEPQAAYTPKKANYDLKYQRIFRIERMKSWGEMRVKKGLDEIHRLCGLFSFGNQIRDEADYLFQKAMKKPALKAHFILLIAHVCLYYALKKELQEVSLENITSGHGYSSRLAYQYYYRMIEALNLPRLVSESNGYIPKFCADLKIDIETAQVAVDINSLYIDKFNTSGLDTRGIAAGAIYMACKIMKIIRSQQIIAGIAKVSDITLRSRAREMEYLLRKHKNEYFPPPQ